MKKLLSLLGSSLLVSSAATPVASCAYNTGMTKVVNNEADYYARVSAQALKSGILNDQSLNVLGKNTSIDYRYTSDYLGKEKILNALPGIYSPDQGASADNTGAVSSLYNSVFGIKQGGYNYTIYNSFQSLKDNNGVKKDTPLWNLVQANDANKAIGTKPDSSISTLAVAITNIAKIFFSNDFSSSIASTALDLLTSEIAKDNINAATDIFNQMNQIVTSSATSIKNVVNSFTQSKLASDILSKEAANTLGGQLAASTSQLFEGLIFLNSGQTKIYNKGNSSKDSASAAFWKLLLNKDSSDLDDVQSIGDNKINNLLNCFVAPVVSFAMTLLHYFRSFDKKSKLSSSEIRNGEYLFSQSKKNDDIKAEILSQPYVSGSETDDYWYVDGKTHAVKLNMQNLFSDLAYYLSPVSGKGTQTLRALNILIGGVKNKNSNIPELNPILEEAFSPLIQMVIGPNGKLTNLINGLPILSDDQKKTINEKISEILGGYICELINWLATDGDDRNSTNAIKPLVQSIGSTLSIIPWNQIRNQISKSDSQTNLVLNILESMSQFINSRGGGNFLNHPWTCLYSGGLLFAVASLPFFSSSEDEKIKELAYGLRQLRDIRTVLTMNLGDLVENIGWIIGRDYDNPLQIPDYLYSANRLSVSNIAKSFAQLENTGALNTLSQNNNYSLNSGAIGDIVLSLMPNSSDAAGKDIGDETQIVVKDGNGNIVSLLMPLFYAIKYYGSRIDITQSKDKADDALKDAKSYSITIPGSKITDKEIISATPINKDGGNIDKNALMDLLGVSQSDNGVTSFIPGSLLFNLSKLYGHGYKKTDAKGKETNIDYPDMTNGAESIFDILSTLSDFTKKCLNDLVSDNYYKYFDPKNWKIKNLKQQNLDVKNAFDKVIQKLDYDLCFYNVDAKKWFTYHVSMSRDSYDVNHSGAWTEYGWIVNELMLQN